jgi:hypothetical protein
LNRANECKNVTAADEVIREKAKALDQQMGVTDFVYKCVMYFILNMRLC